MQVDDHVHVFEGPAVLVSHTTAERDAGSRQEHVLAMRVGGVDSTSSDGRVMRPTGLDEELLRGRRERELRPSRRVARAQGLAAVVEDDGHAREGVARAVEHEGLYLPVLLHGPVLGWLRLRLPERTVHHRAADGLRARRRLFAHCLCRLRHLLGHQRRNRGFRMITGAEGDDAAQRENERSGEEAERPGHDVPG